MSSRAATIRSASDRDVTAIVKMTEERRAQYQGYQPVFWRTAEDSTRHARGYMSAMIHREDVHFLVASQGPSVLGFLLATEIKTPPVYAPGGPTYQIDDFCVSEPPLWSTVGQALLRAAQAALREAGAAQIVVVCADEDEPKADMLRAAELTIASNWWTKAL